MTAQDLQQIQSLVSSAKKVLVLTHRNPSVDTMASALALYLAMKKSGKDAAIVMEEGPLVEVANLVGVDKVQTELTSTGGRNLVITLNNYNSGDVDKVSANEDLEHRKFNLTLIPKDGVALSPDNFSFSSSGAPTGTGGYDLIYTVEVVKPEDLGKLYSPELFAGAQVINIDNHDENKDYGRFNLVEPDAASVSEITTFFLRAIGTQLDEDMSANLYKGILSATNNFQSPKLGPATFEAAAICMRSAARPAQAPAAPAAQAPATPTTPPVEMNNQSGAIPSGGAVPQDWLGPKIYRGGGSTV